MKKLANSQTNFKLGLMSPVLQSRRKRVAGSPSPQRSVVSLTRSASIQKSTRPAKIIELLVDPPQPKKLNFYDSWKLSNNLSLHTKVFIVQGHHPDLRQALLARGWVENKDPSSSFFDFIWVRTGKHPITIQDWQIVNHFPNNFEISAKWNFCENVKNLYLHSINPDTFFPKCFRITSKDIHAFEDSFRLIKAINILKNFTETGQGLPEKVFTALGVCKRWAGMLERRERPKVFSTVCHSEWRILNSSSNTESQFEFKKFFAGKPTNFQDLSVKVSDFLSKLQNLDPQFHLYGTKNIWIVKPGRKSRGREISLFDNLESIKKYTQNPQKWVVQKYIENPLLIERKKFDIRQWVLVSSGHPLTIWVFSKCYLRFAVDSYDNNSLNNLFMHLTNNSISKNSKKFDNESSMWSSDRFIEYLKEEYSEDLWSSKILPGMKNIIKWSLMAVGPLGRKKSFELLGYDFMIDQNMNVWLIEVNSSPTMEYSTVRNK